MLGPEFCGVEENQINYSIYMFFTIIEFVYCLQIKMKYDTNKVKSILSLEAFFLMLVL